MPPASRDEPKEATPRHPLQVMVRQALVLAIPFWLLGVSEVAVRLTYGNGLPEGRIFSTTAQGEVRLWAGHKARIRLFDGTTFKLVVDARGLRADSSSDEAFKAALQGEPATSTASAPDLSAPPAPGLPRPGAGAASGAESPEHSDAAANAAVRGEAGGPASTGQPHSVTIQGITVIDGTPTPVPPDSIPAVTLAPPSAPAPAQLEALRSPLPILLLGDDLALGWGVNDDQTLSHHLQRQGMPTLNGAIPGAGVGDALQFGASLLERYPAHTVLVVVNEADDWEQVTLTAAERLRVSDGWLRPRTGPGADNPVPSSLANRLYALYHFSMPGVKPLLTGRLPDFAPAWLSRPATLVPEAQLLAHQLEQFADEHDAVQLVVAYVPSVFSLSEQRCRDASWWEALNQAGVEPWKSRGLQGLLRRALRPDIRFVDLSEGLTADDYLPGVSWLSVQGQEKMGGLLHQFLVDTPVLEPGGEPEDDASSPASTPASTPHGTDAPP